MHATGLDGVPLIDMLGDSLPSYVYREKPTLDIRKDDIRYLPPPGAEATTTATIAETLAGKVIEPTVCETREPEAGGNRKPQDLDVYAVQQDGAVNIVTDIFEVVQFLHSTLACLTSIGCSNTTTIDAIKCADRCAIARRSPASATSQPNKWTIPTLLAATLRSPM
jgi:hypothetical protein